MKLKIYQVDAFAEQIFQGNPAAVVPLDNWLADDKLQKIAMENNLSETAFYVKENDHIVLRWFTPSTEVDLCGHATLATAHVLFYDEGYSQDSINFFSPRSGKLTVKKFGDKMTMNFPKDDVSPIELTEELLKPFDPKPIEAFKGKTDYVLIFENEDIIKNLEFDLQLISRIKARGVIVSAPGKTVDFVSRFFGPQVGVPEDPVTGSAHTTLMPIWSKKLGKTFLSARQLSARGGFLECVLKDNRVEIIGQAVTYMRGEIALGK
jgi:PhzF family phenazine biosynthesis protein